MKVVEVTEFGGPGVLKPAERPDPVADPGYVVVRIRAANVNPTDLAARGGRMPFGGPEVPFVLGWDFAGDVEAVGAGISDLHEGDRVAGMIHWYRESDGLGAYAERACVEADHVVPLPDSIDYDAGATIPLNSLTARKGLDLLRLRGGEAVLVTGASTAVGSFAVQLAKRAGHRVHGIATWDDEEWVRSLGADEVLPRDVDLSKIGPFPAVFDAVPLGADVFPAIADGGAVAATRQIPDPPRGIRKESFLVDYDRARLREMVDAVAEGVMKTRVDHTLPLERAADAHRQHEEGGLRGKIVLRP